MSNNNILKKIAKITAKIEPNEFKATLTAFSFVFMLMAAYYILRPVRDAMASDWTDAEVSWLWTIQFFVCLAAVSLYGFFVSKVKFKFIVPGIYIFFSGSFLIFYFFSGLLSDRTLIDKSFYIWVSFFAMFHLSVFWSYMSDIFNREQAKRLFAILAAGASAGGLVGPLLITLLTKALGLDSLMLIASVMLLLTIPMIPYLAKLKETELNNKDLKVDINSLKIGGNPLAGFSSFIKDPYLLAIGAFILLYVTINTFIYYEQKNLLEVYDRETRAQILGSIAFLINLFTYVIAFFATSRIVLRFGMGTTLTIVPILLGAGLLILAFAPIVTILLAIQFVRSVGSYSISRPAREMLFTEVDKETRFKAKPVIDVVVYRGGDVISGWFFTGLTEGLGLAFTAVGIVGAGIAAIWAGIGIYLGKLYDGRRNDSKNSQIVDQVS
jgi:ATP:ADP antiporter, AAA family